MTAAHAALLAAAMVLLLGTQPHTVAAHDGPPFPIVTDRQAGPYQVSIWTDPDATSDGSAGGQFWVVLGRAGEAADLLTGTRATVSVQPLDREGVKQVATAQPVQGNLRNQFATLVMDHEGRFDVQVVVDGPLGRVEVTSQVSATYDLRPPAYLIAVYLIPFLLMGLLWTRLLLRRRQGTAAAAPPVPAARRRL
jgi:hypothetical protein